jgi:hypothetical protein
MRTSQHRTALAAQLVILALAFASQPAISARRGPDRHPPVGDWVQLIPPYDICLCCSDRLPVIAPSHNLVVGFTNGAECERGLTAADFTSPPTPRYRSVRGGPPAGFPVAGIFDPSSERILYFFSDWDGSRFTDLTTWALSLGDTLRWERLETLGGPPDRGGTSMIFDTRRYRIVMFGGMRSNADGPPNLDEVWSLSLRDLRWLRLTPAGEQPPARFDHTAVYDPDRDRMLVFGGVATYVTSLFADLWALSLGNHPRWSRLEPEGEGPRGRYGHAAIYDPVAHRLLIYGGIDTLGRLGPWYHPPGDVWELTLRGRHRWQELKPRGVLRIPTAWTGAAYDPVRERMLVGDPFSLWNLELDVPGGPQKTRPGAGIDPPGRSTPEPASSDPIAQTSALADEELRLYDVTGRLMLTRRIPDAAAWLDAFRNGSNAEAAELAPGVYFAQRRDRAGRATGVRIVLLRR